MSIEPSQRSKDGHKYSGPAGDRINSMGQQKSKGMSESGEQLNITFDVAKITRPLALVAEIVKKDRLIVYDGSYIENKKTG